MNTKSDDSGGDLPKVSESSDSNASPGFLETSGPPHSIGPSGATWSCSACTFVNRIDSNACEMCGSFKSSNSGEKEQQSEWNLTGTAGKKQRKVSVILCSWDVTHFIRNYVKKRNENKKLNKKRKLMLFPSLSQKKKRNGMMYFKYLKSSNTQVSQRPKNATKSPIKITANPQASSWGNGSGTQL